jgi:hypothetical protein
VKQVDPAAIAAARLFGFPKHSIDATVRLDFESIPTVTVRYYPEDERGQLMLAHDCIRVIEANFELRLREQRDVTPAFDIAAAIAEASARLGHRIDERCNRFAQLCDDDARRRRWHMAEWPIDRYGFPP